MIFNRSFSALIATISLLISIPTSVEAVWPKPTFINQGNSTFLIDTSNFQFRLPKSAPQDLKNAVLRSQSSIEKDFMRPLVVGRGEEKIKERKSSENWLKKIEIIIGDDHHHQETEMKMEMKEQTTSIGGRRGLVVGQTNFDLSDLLKRERKIENIRTESLKKLEDKDESYSITLDGENGIIKAKNSLGAFRALTTFEQLIYSFGKDDKIKYFEGPVSVVDKPQFPYRGLMLDTSRNFFPKEAIKRQLTAMSMVKLNQFHWHIVDAQSFPLELEGDLKSITENGAYSKEEIYSKRDVKEIIDFAAERGINVNVEIDLPGHNYMGVKDWKEGAILHGNEPDWANWANEPPSGQLALNNSDVNSYVTELISQVSKLFDSPYFGTGGDEINLKVYGAEKESDIDSSLLKPFIELVQNEVEKNGKINTVWEEVTINFPETGKTLKEGTIVEAWTSSANVNKILSSNPGVKIIHAPSDYFYLDCGRGEWLSSATGPSWCPHVSWGKSYSFDPYNGTEGIENGKERVLGGESALWAEQADEHNVDALLWPRAAAAAEVFWTGARYNTSSNSTTPRSLSEALPRLHDLRFRMVDRNIAAEALQPLWCALRDPDQCKSPN